LYKHTPTGEEVRQRRLSQEAQLRRLHREQLFMGKRLRYRLPEESEYEFTPSDTAVITRGLKSTKHEDRMEALKSLSTKLEQPSEELRKFVADGHCIDLLIRFLNGTDADEKLQSLWCLTNIAANEGALAEQVLPAVPYLIALTASDNLELKNQATWALGNLAAEGEKAREHLHASGALKPLVDLTSSTKDEKVLQTACFALSNMARKPNTFFDELFALGLPQTIAKQLAVFKDSQGCVTEMAWVYAYLAASSSETQVDQLLATGAVDLLLQHAAAVDKPGVSLIPIIRTLGNIVAGTDAQTHAVVSKEQFVQLIARCIRSSSSRAVEKESLWVLSSATASKKDDIRIFVDAGVVPDLAQIVETQNFDIRKEAAFSLLNIAIVGERLADLPNAQLAPAFVEFVRSQDEELVRMGVQYFQIIFTQLPDKQGPELLRGVQGGIDALENVVAVSEDDDTRSMASSLIDIYYGD
ncbi:ARM repeat-containing protein, partial [Martensiomyces pterosporus]